jgi:phenylacetaldehyde dehydrogenase
LLVRSVPKLFLNVGDVPFIFACCDLVRPEEVLNVSSISFGLMSPPLANFVRRRHQLLIGGAWRDAASGERLEVLDPGTGEVVGHIPNAGAEDVNRAVQAAREAFDRGPWYRMSGAERGKLIYKLAVRLEELSEELSQIEALDAGKPLAYAKLADLPLTCSLYHYFAGWASKITGDTLSLSAPGEYHAYTLREPVGVVGLITPWNFPLVLAAYKLAPALAAGCTVILKPAEQTSLSALRLGEIIQEVGFPPGVVNIITGDGESAGAALVAHPDVDKISFTGSTEVGKRVVRSVSSDLKRVSLELGGKSPMFVFPDADLDAAIAGTAGAIFFHQGQVCTAGSRLYVHEKVYEKVVAGIAAIAGAIRPDHGLRPNVTMGPLVSQEQLERVSGYVDAGVAEGAEIVVGGKRIGDNGYFFQPTVLAKTNASMSVVREEIFGPVLCAMPFADEDLDRVAGIANATSFGLAASIWTQNLRVAHKLARRIKAGNIWINAHNLYDPNMAFGGYKQSGWGRECGYHAIELFTEVKSVMAPL